MTVPDFLRFSALLLCIASVAPTGVQDRNTESTTDGIVSEQPFKIGVGVPNAVAKTDMCTDEELEWMDSKFAEYTIAYASVFFGDTTLNLTDSFIPIGSDGFDWKAFDDYNTYEKKKFDVQAKNALKITSEVPPGIVDLSHPLLKSDASTTNDVASSSLKSYPSPPDILDLSWCATNVTIQCVTIDFDRTPGGAPLMKGQYVSDEWKHVYGVAINARGTDDKAYTPTKQGTGLHQARIFDSTDPGKKYPGGNKELGSPNEHCKDKGKGRGKGGEPKNNNDVSQENCKPLGNILIIQEQDKAVPVANRKGGEFIFSFDRPVKFDSIGLLDVTTDKVSIKVITSNGETSLIGGIKMGKANGVQEVIVGKIDVVELILYMPESAAVTDLKFCVDVCEANSSSRSASGVSSSSSSPSSSARDISTSKKSSESSPSKLTDSSSSDGRRSLRLGAKPKASFSLLREGDRVSGKEKLNDHTIQRNLGAHWKYTFVYGAMNSYQCRFCGKDNYDQRRKQRSMRFLKQHAIENEREFLIGALESVMSFSLTMDLGWSLREWLRERNIDFGCFGDGKSLSAVFELVFSEELAFSE